MKKITLMVAITGAGATLFTGCISHHETVTRESQPVKVEFENDKAARTFYEKLSHMASRDHQESRTEFCVPIVFNYTRTSKTSENEIFNEAVRRCDTNQDGKITETEANIFSEQK